MPWFRLDDSFHSHPKVAELENGPCFAEAVTLWIMAGTWCAKWLTDGGVSMSALRRLVPFDPTMATTELVRVQLWIESKDNFWVFKDWHLYQPTKQQVEKERRAARQRMKQRRRDKPTGQFAKSSENVRANNGRTFAKCSPTPIPIPNHIDPPQAPPSPDVARSVFEHWVGVMAKDPAKTKLTEQRRAKIKARLAEGYTQSDLLAAIDGCRKSAWHMGSNPEGRRWDELTLILRDGAQVEKLRDTAAPQSAPSQWPDQSEIMEKP